MQGYFRGATVLTCAPAAEGPLPGTPPAMDAEILVRDGRIAALLPPGSPGPPDVPEFDVRGRWILPGFTQIHVHLVQALFRGLADDLALLDWLSSRIWPLERAHDADSVYWSARLGLSEMLLAGTTAILDMATVHHTDAVFEAAREAGIHAFIGKALMDRDEQADLGEPTAASLADAGRLCARWHGRERLRYAWSPRFVPSCSEALLRGAVENARGAGCLLHTHASENRDEVALVRRLTGRDNVKYLDDIGFTGPDVVLAHCVHLSEEEERILADSRTTAAHCPSSNLKLGSGIAPIQSLLLRGVRVGLGADGAPCNNRMDPFTEMRTAALLQKAHGQATALPAPTALALATRLGAEALGLESGVLAPGRPADFVVIDPDVPWAWSGGDPRSALVYAHTPASVRQVWIGGECVVRDGVIRGWDWQETLAGARAALNRVRDRVGR